MFEQRPTARFSRHSLHARLSRGAAPARSVALITVAACLIGGCATGSSGPSLLEPGSNGYILTKAEQNWNCGSLENAIQSHVLKIVNATYAIKLESEAAAPTVSRLFTRLTDGPGSDSPWQAQAKADRVAAEAYNTALQAKGCPKVDLDAKIASFKPTLKPSDLKPTGPKPLEPVKSGGTIGTF